MPPVTAVRIQLIGLTFVVSSGPTGSGAPGLGVPRGQRVQGVYGCAVPIIENRRPAASCTAGHPIGHRRGGGSGRVPKTLHRNDHSILPVGLEATMKTAAPLPASSASIRRRSSPGRPHLIERQAATSDIRPHRYLPRQSRCLAVDHDGKTRATASCGPRGRPHHSSDSIRDPSRYRDSIWLCVRSRRRVRPRGCFGTFGRCRGWAFVCMLQVEVR